VFRGHEAGTVAALAVYAVSVSGLFGISALYHRGTWSPPWSVRLQRMDHLMIFFLIAGTATPAFLLAMPGPFGLTCLIVMWTLIGAAAIIHLCWMSAPEALVGATFIGLGSLAGLALPEVWINAGVIPGTLMLAPEPCSTISAGRTRPPRCSVTTRSSTPVSAPRPLVSTPRSCSSRRGPVVNRIHLDRCRAACQVLFSPGSRRVLR
jgi:hypothetical protein